MNTELKLKFIRHLNGKKANRGFTLIELLVVVIIIGVLAAIALPNLLSQVAKGRQAEAKNNLGAMNRAQQAYRLEEMTFASTATDLPVKFSWQYYTLSPFDSAKSYSTYYTQALNAFQDDILDYAGGVMQSRTGEFEQVICEEKSLNSNNNNTPDFAIPGGGTGGAVTVTCHLNRSKLVNK